MMGPEAEDSPSSRHVGDIGIVIVTYNSERHLEALLDSIPAALGRLSFTTVAVDNGSTDRTLELLQSYPDLMVFTGENVGYSAAVNRGIHSLTGARAFLVLNPDVLLAANSVERMYEALMEPSAGIVAPTVLEADGRLSWSLRREPSILRSLGLGRTGWKVFAEYVNDPSEYTYPHFVDWAVGAILLVSAESYDVVGDWDETYFLFSEETDFCLRARDLGFRTLFQPTAQATHIGGGSGRNARVHSMQAVNRVRLYARRHPLVLAWIYFGLTVATELSWWARGNQSSRDAVIALLFPKRRPHEIRASSTIVPM